MKHIEPSVIAVDFDGTIVTHQYPRIGIIIPNAINTLERLLNRKHKLILSTMRSGATLIDAVDFLARQGIELYGVNENPDQKEWTYSPKVYAHAYIGDDAMGCPLVHPEEPRHCDKSRYARPYVDWVEMEKLLSQANYL